MRHYQVFAFFYFSISCWCFRSLLDIIIIPFVPIVHKIFSFDRVVAKIAKIEADAGINLPASDDDISKVTVEDILLSSWNYQGLPSTVFPLSNIRTYKIRIFV